MRYAPSKALVTGAGGFIGRVVVRALAMAGYDVVAHIGPPGAELAVPGEAASAVWFAIEDASRFASSFRGCDVVVHLAGPAAVTPSFEDPQRYLCEHLLGTAALLATAQAEGVRRLVYISSAEVYGRTSLPRVSEDVQPRPRSPYAVAKIASEAYVMHAALTGGPEAFILRPFSVYGPQQRRTSVLGTILSQALGGDLVTVHDLAPVRDYCHVGDVARAVVLATTAPLEQFDVVNIGTGIGTSVSELIATVERSLARPLTVRVLGANRGPADILKLVADRRHAGSSLGWEPRIDLDEGVSLLLREQLV